MPTVTRFLLALILGAGSVAAEDLSTRILFDSSVAAPGRLSRLRVAVPAGRGEVELGDLSPRLSSWTGSRPLKGLGVERPLGRSQLRWYSGQEAGSWDPLMEDGFDAPDRIRVVGYELRGPRRRSGWTQSLGWSRAHRPGDAFAEQTLSWHGELPLSSRMDLGAAWAHRRRRLDPKRGIHLDTHIPRLHAEWRDPRARWKLRLQVLEEDARASDRSRRDVRTDWKLRAENRIGEVRAVLDLLERAARDLIRTRRRDVSRLALTLDTRRKLPSGRALVPRLSWKQRLREDSGAPGRGDVTDTWGFRLGLVLRPREEFRVGYRLSQIDPERDPRERRTGDLDLSYRRPLGVARDESMQVRWRHIRRRQELGPGEDERRGQLAFSRSF